MNARVKMHQAISITLVSCPVHLARKNSHWMLTSRIAVDVHCVQSLDCHLSALDVPRERSEVCNGKTWYIFEIWIRATVSIPDGEIHFGAFLGGKQIGGTKISLSWE